MGIDNHIFPAQEAEKRRSGLLKRWRLAQDLG
jgi:hypothetical protein